MDARQDGDRKYGWSLVDLGEVSLELGISSDAVRKCMAGGSLDFTKENRRALVWVDEGRREGRSEAQIDQDSLLETKDETIRILEEQLRLQAEEIQLCEVIIRQLIQANEVLAQRMLELEAPQERSTDTLQDEAGRPSGEGVP